MIKSKIVLTFFFALFINGALANVEEFAEYLVEAKILVEARDYLKDVKRDLSLGNGLNEEELFELERDLLEIGVHGCDCPQENHIIRGQAYALIGAINGVLSKETKSIRLGKKSYYSLIRARELDPRNVDAIRGQGEALKAILKEGVIARRIVSFALGINLKKEKQNLVKDLRTFQDNPILQRLASELDIL